MDCNTTLRGGTELLSPGDLEKPCGPEEPGLFGLLF